MRVGANDFRTKLIGGLGEGMLEASPHVGRAVILISTKAAWGIVDKGKSAWSCRRKAHANKSTAACAGFH
jgi:hypothetical protein